MADESGNPEKSKPDSLIEALKGDKKLARNLNAVPMSGLAQIGIRARRVAESILSGQHTSNQFGQNIEFADYREYVPGDDLRTIDWKMYARSDRFYIKRFEEETAIRAVVVLDVSKSMLYGEGTQQKMQYGADLAAGISTLLTAQKDAVGLALYDEELRYWLAPVASPEQLRRIYTTLETCRPQNRTETGSTLRFIAQRIQRRGFLILISDFWDQVEETLAGLNHFAARKFEVLVFHLLTREELEFPFLGSLEIQGLEDDQPLETDGRAIREGYRRRLEDHQEQLRAGCSKLGIDYNLVVTDEPVERAMTRVLSNRRRVRT
jgi:uncharacterized protein (DUF58 family)